MEINWYSPLREDCRWKGAPSTGLNGSSRSLHHWFPLFFPFSFLCRFRAVVSSLLLATSLHRVYSLSNTLSLLFSTQYLPPSWQQWPARRQDPATANMTWWYSLRSVSWRPTESEYPVSPLTKQPVLHFILTQQMMGMIWPQAFHEIKYLAKKYDDPGKLWTTEMSPAW